MSDPKDPDRKDPKDPDRKDPKADPFIYKSTAGRSARPGAIGAELGDLDFEPDALLDTLMPDEEQKASPAQPEPAQPEPAEAELEELETIEEVEDEAAPMVREAGWPEEEAPTAEQQPTPAEDEVDDEAPTVFRPAPWAEEAVTKPGPGQPPPAPRVPEPPPPFTGSTESGLGPPSPAPPAAEIAPAPAARAPPRPVAAPPRPTPSAPPAPAAGLPPPDATAEPPAVIPPGPPPREPFGPAVSPTGPPAIEASPATDASELEALAEGAADAEDELPTRVLDADKLMEIAATFDAYPDDDLTTVYEGDPTDGLDSLPPPGVEPEPVQLPPSMTPPTDELPGWADEQPAAARLAERHLLEDWMARAEWLESEARAKVDPQAKARALLVASELWALTGDLKRAQEIVSEAASGATSAPLVGRQLRWLAAAEGDWEGVVSALEVEMRASPTPEMRTHGAYLSSEIHRLRFGDHEGAQRRLEHAARAMPEDPRAHVMRFASQLGPNTETPSVRWPQAPALSALVDAAHEIARMRTGEAPPTDAEPSPAVAFQEARRALMARNPVGAGGALEALARVEGLGRASLWLAACLLAPSAQTRPRSIELLKSLLGQEPTAATVRALASRALEQGDASAVQAAIKEEGAVGAFSSADRVALAALTGGDEAAVRSQLQALLTDESLRPLATAALSCMSPPGAHQETASGSEQSQAETALGRALAVDESAADPQSPLRHSFERFIETHDETALGRVLALELAQVDHDVQEVADQLAQWPESEAERKGGYDRLVAAALVRETAGKQDDAARDYAGALGANPASEAATRALLASAEPAGAADLLSRLADATSDDAQRSLLLVEAALQRGTEDAERFDELLGRAADAAPTLPYAYRFGERLARLRGDASQLLSWLRLHREASTDSVEQALDSVREALLIADSNVELAASLMEEAISARPSDVALRELHERLSPGADPEKGKWREEAAAEADESAKVPLLLAAALEYQRAGDRDAATRAALAAADLGGSDLASVMAEQTAIAGSGAARLSEKLFEQARGESDPLVQRELYDRLSRLDLSRGERSSAILWQNAILERQPQYLPALRRLEHEYITAGRHEELEPIAATLTKLLDSNEVTAHAVVATRHRARSGAWDTARELVQLAAKGDTPSLWALRQQSAHARVAEDDAELLETEKKLCDQASRAIDAATLALRAAEAATRLQRIDEAKALLERAIELIPDHLVALTTRAEVLEQASDYEGAAEAREAIARCSQVEAHRLAAWHQSAILWLDQVKNEERGTVALEFAAEIEGAEHDVFDRLQALYVAAGERSKLADLLEHRLAQTTDPEQRVALEVTRGRALAEIGDRGAAKEALAAALDANPDHADALDAFAEVCVAEGDWEDAEQAWIRLARHASDAKQQVDIYMKLGALYEGNLPNPQRAELSYLEVLKRQPDDLEATKRLVQVYGQLGNQDKSVELQTELVKNAKSREDKRARTIELAEVYELIAKDRKQAQATLEKARKAWSTDGAVIRALAHFYQRNDEHTAVHMLLDRAAGDARRALNTGRFDSSFFDVLGTVAEIRGNQDAANVAQATLAALEGTEPATPIGGAGAAAGKADLDDLLAPELFTLPLRVLLQKTGSALEAAYALDLRTLRAAALPQEAATYVTQVQQLAAGFGLGNVEVYVSPSLGLGCLPASSNPARLVLGSGLLESEDETARWFLVLRGLKILQSGGSALARTAPIDLWPVTASYLSLLAVSWQPQNVDAKKLADARKRIQPALPEGLGGDIPVLALEVVASIGNRASQLGTAVNQWGNRAALLALGDPAAALRAIAYASGQASGPPPSSNDRKKWIMRNPEARDLAVFSVSEQYAKARAQLGVAG